MRVQGAAPANTIAVAGVIRLVASLVIAAILAALIAIILAWGVGRILTDRFAWSQWLWWIPTPAALAAVALALLLALRPAGRGARSRPRRRRCRIIGWSALATALAVYFAAIEHRLLRPSPSDAPPARGGRGGGGDAFRVAHWNITKDSDSYDLMLEQIEALDPDLFILTGSPWGVHQALRAAREERGLSPPFTLGPLMMLTELPVITRRPLVATGDGIYVLLLEVDAIADLGRPVVIYAIDLPSDPKLPRAELARRVRRLIAETNPPPADIVIGDFNITRGSASLGMLFPDDPPMRHAFDDAGHGYGATYPRQRPLWHIDHVLLGPALRAERYDVSDKGAGRHRAQEAWITAR